MGTSELCAQPQCGFSEEQSTPPETCCWQNQKGERWEHQAAWDILELNNNRQYHRSQGDFQSDWKNALKAEDGLPTTEGFLLFLFHGSFFLKTWRKHASCEEKRRLLALASSPSLKWWLYSEKQHVQTCFLFSGISIPGWGRQFYHSFYGHYTMRSLEEAKICLHLFVT